MLRRRLGLGPLVLAGSLIPAAAPAQVLGPLSWQMQPYCNVLTLTLTTTPVGLTLVGADDQCGATNKAGAVGMATFNAAGNVTLNLTIVTAPAGRPVHVSAVVSPATGNGTWTDSTGNTGTFAFFANVVGLPARPSPPSGLAPAVITTAEIAPGAVGASDINAAEVQARVAGTCAGGQAVAGISASGGVNCVSPQLTGFTFDSATVTLAANQVFFTTCPAGRSTVSAGWDALNPMALPTLIGFRPAVNGPQVRWGLRGVGGFIVYWTCANAVGVTIVP